MRLIKSIKLAFNMLVHSKLRSWLSVIGIVIGVASVITILALSNGMKQDMEERLGGLGADIITISKGFSRASGAGGSFQGGPPGLSGSSSGEQKEQNLTNKDIQALKLIPNIKYLQGKVSGKADITYLAETMSVTVTGVDPKVWKDIETTELDSGRYLSQGDTNVVVLSYGLAKERFKNEIQINSQVIIEGVTFRVVGILEESSTSGMGGGGGGASLYMPIQTARTVLEDVGEKEFNSIEIKVENVNLLDDTVSEIEERLRLTRAVTEKTQDFSVSSVKAMQETISETIESVTLFLTGIAAISLLVGAVGIANTMFTTVLEKIKDIGIMKSIGAKNREILSIFLFNSSMIGLAGGILGGILGVIISKTIMSVVGLSIGGGPRGMSLSSVVSPQIVLAVFGISVLIGILAGIIPAYQASKMNPVDALRYE
ncbi:MAG: ABC transporter permease [Candidatus Nanoarchaeia archaeon]|nr:ABC transporter permease [Candidatus Nanoarchaeia archaeon]